MAKDRTTINREYRERAAASGLVQMLLVVPKRDRERVKKYVAKLRREWRREDAK